MGWFSNDGETRKESDLFGNEKEVHFDKDGKKTGETRTINKGCDLPGYSEYKETYGNSGNKVSETRKESGYFGDKEVTRSSDGSTSETYHESGYFGDVETHLQNGRKVGESHHEGSRKVHLNSGGSDFDYTTRTNKKAKHKGKEKSYDRSSSQGDDVSGNTKSTKCDNTRDSYVADRKQERNFLPEESRVRDHKRIEDLIKKNNYHLPKKRPRLLVAPEDSTEERLRAINSEIYDGFTFIDNFENTYQCTKCKRTWTEKAVIGFPERTCPYGCSNASENSGFLKMLYSFFTGEPLTGKGELINSVDRRK